MKNFNLCSLFRSRGKKEAKQQPDEAAQCVFDPERKSRIMWTKKYQPRYLPVPVILFIQPIPDVFMSSSYVWSKNNYFNARLLIQIRKYLFRIRI